MKRYLTVLAAINTCIAAPAAAQTAKDAVSVDPSVHNVVFENDYVRVFEARASHPAASPMHSHPPFVFVGMETGRAKLRLPDGKSAMLDVHPGQVLWLGDGAQHSWELVSGKVRVIGVEIKPGPRQTASLLPAVIRKANDAVAVDPEVHHVVLENDQVRVFDGRAARGKRSPMHSHTPFVFISLGTTRMRLTLPDGKSTVLDTYPGQVMWMEDAEHSWEILAGDAHVIAVEVKSAQRAKQVKGN